MLLLICSFIFFLVLCRPNRTQLSCGLFGMLSSSITSHEARAMSYMSYLTCFRGTDSTGIAIGHTVGRGANRSFNTILAKTTQTPPEFMRSGEIQEMFNKHSSDMVVIAGHSRQATQGSLKASNAHPFRVKHLIGMHNGTVHGLANLKEDKTDSQRIYEIMADEGVQKAVNACKHGAYALVWLDQKDDTINFLRNDSRPLYFMLAPGNLFFWMSEKWMLDVLKSYMNWSDKSAEISQLPVNQHIKIKMGQTNYESTEVKPELQVPFFQGHQKKAEETKVDSPFRFMHTNNSTLSVCNIKDYPYNNTETKETPIKIAQDRLPGTTYKYVGPFPKMNVADLSELFDEGCFNCQTIPDYDLQGSVKPFRVFWLGNSKEPKKSIFLCQDCIDNRHHQMLNLSIREFTIGGLRPVIKES